MKWVTAGFNQVISPAPKDFDVDVNQVSITDARKKNIDFSSGYYDVAQSVVTVKGSKAAGAKSIADLKGLKLGAQVGTTSLHRREGHHRAVRAGRRLQHERRREGGAAERPGRRARRRPADRPVPRRGRPEERPPGRPPAVVRHARAVRHGARQGQQPHRVRLAGGRRAARRRHAEAGSSSSG
ncbi:hypothetical protein GCM10025868_31280 [Angustibacter aerolatus]|uniref:Solute-binding protein family 3/N-terminal domain-containing protein n=1 Tax=Angustibacter aerolatus TaxID=1162965 RepID=A0ABQ6JI34_9ACTN|nr:transporter substrate-binding domain-containing protein [Angustibacter aerolatus]GMA87878.1 hypothetical protein GCM10025868_31280 [Angustibacter aerolatus]